MNKITCILLYLPLLLTDLILCIIEERDFYEERAISNEAMRDAWNNKRKPFKQ